MASDRTQGRAGGGREDRGGTEPGVALVTGGSRGIGRAVVEALSDAGWTVHFCSRNPESVEEALSELRARDGAEAAGPVHGRAVDVREQAQVDAFVAAVEEAEGRIDCLVNNAGLGHFAAVDELSGDEWREVLHTNLDGCFYFLRAVSKGMRQRGSGWVLNVASLAGKNPFAGGAAYNASKFGLLGLSDAAMLDLRQSGVRVAAILPGSVDTAFHGRDERGWMLTPGDVAQAVLDLLAYPPHALPSRIELRPSKPPK